MTAKEAAEILGKHINSITKYIKQGKLKVLEHKGTRVNIDPASVFALLKPEQKVKLKEISQIDKHKAWYREYMKEYSKEYDKSKRRKIQKNTIKTKTYIDEHGRKKVRKIRSDHTESLGQRLKLIGQLEEYIGEEGLKHLTFQQLCRLYGFKELAEKYAKLKYKDDVMAREHGQLPQPPIYLLNTKDNFKNKLIDAIKKLEEYRGVRMRFDKKYTPEEFYQKIKEYFEQNETIEEELYIPKYNMMTKVKRKGVWNWAGLAKHLGITQERLREYMLDENMSDYHDIMEWAANMIEDRIINYGAMDVINPKLSSFLLKNISSAPHEFYDKKVTDKKETKFSRIEIELVSSNGGKKLDAGEIKMIENESMKNKEGLGIDIKKAIEAYEKQKQKEEAIDVAFTTEENNNKR